ncbi:hypothetical protein F7725_003780 [Dissostichus mawsoni]|uniref:Uncharacterized protein n=1 Tax=Dissostichus mawsoni TaxID=36200 RepID=A0A7J5YB63_DISMA|nr:hypothetical protein F7725_003780 [Dissostichus mawsoni]
MVGDTSPVSPLTSSSLSTSSSPPPFYSPPPSPSSLLLQGDKDGMESDLLSLPWLGHTGHLRQNSVSVDIKEDVFGDFDWMAERVDLSEYDLDSLIPDEDSPSCSEDLLASLDCPMELDSLHCPLSQISPLLLFQVSLLPPLCAQILPLLLHWMSLNATLMTRTFPCASRSWKSNPSPHLQILRPHWSILPPPRPTP